MLRDGFDGGAKKLLELPGGEIGYARGERWLCIAAIPSFREAGVE